MQRQKIRILKLNGKTMDQACEEYKLIQRNNRFYDSMNIDPHSSENKNTKRKTETDMRIFTAYLVSSFTVKLLLSVGLGVEPSVWEPQINTRWTENTWCSLLNLN